MPAEKEVNEAQFNHSSLFGKKSQATKFHQYCLHQMPTNF